MAAMSSDFQGLRAVVTGAGSGIGLEVAQLLASQGATVCGLDLNEGSFTGVGTYVPCDVSSEASVTAAVAEVATVFGSGLDILINNAGIGAIGSVVEASPDDWEKVFAVNVFGTARVVRHLHPLLIKGTNPVIVNTC
ncbi:MAG: SDR family NAD(P)-dependent oxidoreductase, partial [Actinobacteria bacterium]|nr:SDR family NAD(P)-dependent oxidoreductase [Actinomycetota bacterium]